MGQPSTPPRWKIPSPPCARLTEGGRGADIVIEAAGRATSWEWAMQMVRKGGTVNLFAGCAKGTEVKLDPWALHYSEITLKSTFHHTPRFMREAMESIARGEIRASDFVTGEAPLADLPGVFKDMLHRNDALKTAISSLDVGTICRPRPPNAEPALFSSAMLPTPELQIAQKLPPEGCTAEVAQRYTRWLATHHYENFSVVSWLLPRHLHQHFYNIYAYCRWSDDLGDEVPNHARALRLLDAWEEEVQAIYEPEGAPRHPVLIALAETIRAKDIPRKPFTDLLRAFRQDQTVHRYATWGDVLDYCVYSANPVGRLVLYLCGYRDEERQRLSDFTCTALQLANFWQDVSRDIEKGRIYIPLEALAAHGLDRGRHHRPPFRWPIRRADALFDRAHARAFRRRRAARGPRRPELRVDIELFSRGGLAVLDAIEAAGCNTLEYRPALTQLDKLRLARPRIGSASSSAGARPSRRYRLAAPSGAGKPAVGSRASA